MGDDGIVFFYVSPYIRTLETLDTVRSNVDESRIIGIREEPRICEQQFGNFQNLEQVRRAKEERHKFGHFFYRFPNGESGLDVYNRVSSLWLCHGLCVAGLRAAGVRRVTGRRIISTGHGVPML
jgi:broad specificity phosphatase PhoE